MRLSKPIPSVSALGIMMHSIVLFSNSDGRVLLVTAHTNADLAAQRRAVGTAVQRTATANAPRTGGTSPSPLFFFGSVAGESFDMRATALPSPNHSLSRHPLDAVYKA